MVHPFDLQTRAEVATHALTALGDEQQQGLMYFLGEWRMRPPIAFHGLWDYGDGSGRQIDALTLLRAMVPAGSPAATASEGEQLLEDWMLRNLGADGLSWLPQETWTEPWGKELLLADPTVAGPFAEISWAQRGTLLGLSTRFMATSDERYRVAGQKLVDGLLRLAIRDEHGLYYPEGYYQPAGWKFDRLGLHPAVEEYNAAVAISALRFFEATSYEPALKLARDLTTCALFHTPCFLPDGRLRQTVGDVEGHFHTHSNFALSVLKLGITTGQREYISWARQTYDVLLDWGTDFGWFPEGFGLRHGEVCCFTDMIEMALLLGKHVRPSYYADAERFGRNQLLETQFLSLDQLQGGIDRLPALDKPTPANPAAWTQQNVAASQVGAFASRSTINDAFHLDASALMQCCNAAGGRALYDLWRYAVETERRTDGVQQHTVNLRFSVETPNVRIVSHEPTSGRLDITAREQSRVAVRLPAGVSFAIAIAGDERTSTPLESCNGYVTLDVNGGQSTEVHYDLPEQVRQYRLGTAAKNEEGTGYWRGETMMRVAPVGQYYPLYQRAHDLAPVQPSPGAGPAIPSL